MLATILLQWASKKGRLETVNSLLNSCCTIADANMRSASDKTPLHLAAERGHAEIVKALIDHGVEVNAIDRAGNTALHLAAENGHVAVVNVLLNQSADREVGKQSVRSIVPPADSGLSRHSIRNKVDVSQIPQSIAQQGRNLTNANATQRQYSGCEADAIGHTTPQHGHLTSRPEYAEVVGNFMFNRAKVNACNNGKMTSLHLACQNGHSSIVEILLDNHAIVDVTGQTMETPFYIAAKNGHADVVDVLLRRDVSDFFTNHRNETPLHVAVKNRHTKVVEVIVNYSCRILGKLSTKDELNIQEKAKNLVETIGNEAIEFLKPHDRRHSDEIVCTEKNTPFELMLESDGYSALELAVSSIQPEMVRILLCEDRCVYSKKYLGNSFRCIMETIKPPEDQYEVMSKMTQYLNIHEMEKIQCYDINYKAMYRNIKEIAQVLMKSSQFDANIQDDELNSLLHAVIKQCRDCFYDYLAQKSSWRLLKMQAIDDLIQLLLEKGTDFNMRNAFGETPLIVASAKGCSHAIQVLFDWEHKSRLKLDVDARDRYGATALIKAAETHHVAAMRLLLKHGVSVNLHDYYGFTALHAAVYEPNVNWFDLHFFCQRFRKRNFDNINKCLEVCRRDKPIWGQNTIGPFATMDRLQTNLEHDKKTTLFKEDMVKLLLANDETCVNATDFRGNTPLDLAVKSSKRITVGTFRALKKRGAMRKISELVDRAPMQLARIDKRSRSPLHRLVISHVSNYAVEDMKAAKRELDHERFDLMVHGILLCPENFAQSANATDDKGRTPLHYAVMPPSYVSKEIRGLARVLYKIGSNVNAVDMYGKTPLHYAEMSDQYDFLVKHGADESTQDKRGHTPRDLRQLRESVAAKMDNASKFTVDWKERYMPRYTEHIPITKVTELSNRKLVETMRLDSPGETIWNLWLQNDFLTLNRRVSQLKPPIKHLVKRLADGIQRRDSRFECQPILVGSADEETKATISSDFDFNFELTKFSQLCDVFPHPLGPTGFFELKRSSDDIKWKQSEDDFACFFNSDKCLLTNEVNSRFQIVLEEILHDHYFWQSEHLFEWNVTDEDEKNLYKKPPGLFKTVRLRMIHPITDGEGGFLFFNVSIDIVACVHFDDSCFRDQSPDKISPTVKPVDCTLVFDRPRFDPNKPKGVRCVFSETFARISFSKLESRRIRESATLIKAAYMVCKMILFDQYKTTYQLKTSVLLCVDDLMSRNRCETRDEEMFTKTELASLVERIMFRFVEFYRHDMYPCYFMPSFRQPLVRTEYVANKFSRFA